MLSAQDFLNATQHHMGLESTTNEKSLFSIDML